MITYTKNNRPNAHTFVKGRSVSNEGDGWPRLRYCLMASCNRIKETNMLDIRKSKNITQ